MYTPRSELAPTLDWMLPSAQVSDDALTEALVRDYARPLVQLAQALLPDPSQAQAAAQQTIVRAVLDRRRYSGASSARAWLYARALQFFRPPRRAARRASNGLQALAAAFKLPALGADSHLQASLAAFDPAQALALYLAVGHGLLAAELADVLARPVEEVETLLEAVGRRLDQHRQQCAECALRPGGLPEMEGRLRTAWQAATSGPGATDNERLTAEVLAQVKRQRRTRRIFSHWPELAVVGVLMVAMFTLGWLSNRTWLKPQSPAASANSSSTTVPAGFFQYGVKPGDTLDSIAQKAGTSVSLILFLNLLPPQTELYPGQLLTLPASQPRADRLTPPPFTPAAPPPLLTWQSSLHDIQQRAYSSLDYWHSLWADVQIIQYGLPGYVGPPQSTTRKQVWLLQPAYSRVIYGPAGGEPTGTYVIVNGHVYGQDLNSQRAYEDLTSDLVIDLDLQTLFIPGELSLKNGQFRLAGQEPVAGRPTMMLDWQNVNGGRVYRYWVDAETGVILRRREYGGANFSAVLDDITVTDIAYNVNLPLSLFDPAAYKGDHFALDYTGTPAVAAAQPAPSEEVPASAPAAIAGHEALPRQSPPANFDPARSWLTLQWQPPPKAGAQARVDVFADRYYLGQLSVESASILACRRSPDGRQIAFSHVVDTVGKKASLEWVSLADLSEVHAALPNGSVSGEFAFAPDSRRLAFFGCEASGSCGLYIVDTAADQRVKLMDLSFADYLLWRPDGQALGLLASGGRLPTWKYVVVDAQTGAVSYQGDFNWLSLDAGPDSPTHNWQVPARYLTGGLEACTAPPGSTP